MLHTYVFAQLIIAIEHFKTFSIVPNYNKSGKEILYKLSVDGIHQYLFMPYLWHPSLCFAFIDA